MRIHSRTQTSRRDVLDHDQGPPALKRRASVARPYGTGMRCAYEDTDLGLQAIRSAGMEAVDVRELTAKR